VTVVTVVTVAVPAPYLCGAREAPAVTAAVAALKVDREATGATGATAGSLSAKEVPAAMEVTAQTPPVLAVTADAPRY
jgi:hypothetical protein